MHVADLSFTFLHWRMMEQLRSKKINILNVDEAQIELLCYNILPGGETILHKLFNKGDVIDQIFFIAHESKKKEKQFHVPFLPNLRKQSPMHLCKDKQDIIGATPNGI